MKWIVRIGVALVVLFALTLLATFVFIEPLIRKSVEVGGTHATGVKTTLAEVDIGLVAGALKLEGLEVANPEGFAAPHFLALGASHVEVTAASLLQDKISVPLIELREIDVNLEEAAGKTNFSVILDNLKRLSPPAGDPTDGGPPESEPPAPETEEQAPGKSFVIGELLIADVAVHTRWAGQSLDIEIPEIRLKDIGSDSDSGAAVSEVTAVVVQAILDAVLRNGNLLPEAFTKDLSKALEGLGSLEEKYVSVAAGKVSEATKEFEGVAAEGAKEINELGEKGAEKINEATQGAGDEINRATEDLNKNVKKFGDGVGRIFGDKEAPKKP